jgi:hypothetical protein
LPTAISDEVGIGLGELVPVVAFHLDGIPGSRSDASQDVYPVSDRLKVRRVTTRRVAANVVNDKTIGDRLDF